MPRSRVDAGQRGAHDITYGVNYHASKAGDRLRKLIILHYAQNLAHLYKDGLVFLEIHTVKRRVDRSP